MYSFGVVLLELATGRHPVDENDHRGGESSVVLCDVVRSAMEEGRGIRCIDRNLRNPPEVEVMQILKLGLVCTSQTPSKRPSMAEVVQVLESIKPGSGESL